MRCSNPRSVDPKPSRRPWPCFETVVLQKDNRGRLGIGRRNVVLPMIRVYVEFDVAGAAAGRAEVIRLRRRNR